MRVEGRPKIDSPTASTTIAIGRLRTAGLGLLVAVLSGCARGVLDPRGPIAASEKSILLNSLGIMLAVVIPTIVATLAFAWWFRRGNTRAVFRPEWSYSGQIELVVWAIPMMVVLLLGSIAWVGSHQLEPSRPLDSKTAPIEVQVVSMDWKWLFIYPQQGIATVNHLVIPAGVPVRFHLTSTSVMNSFFVPQLGSQIYTMPGMTTTLNLQADSPGRFAGLSAHYSGAGFADMRFAVDAVPAGTFVQWVARTRGTGQALDANAYAKLSRRDANIAPTRYGSVNPGLFDAIAMQRMPDPAKPVPDDGRSKH